MSGQDSPLKPARSRKAALLILAGVICAGGGGFSAETYDGASPGISFAFFSPAVAEDGRGHGGRDHGGGDNRGSDYGSGGGRGHDGGDGGSDSGSGGRGRGGGDGGPDYGSGGGGSSHGQDGGSGDTDSRASDNGRAHGPSYGGGSGSSSNSSSVSSGLSYDANRNMLKLDFSVGGGGRRHDSLEPEHHWHEHHGSDRDHHRPEPSSHGRHEHEHERWHDHEHERRHEHEHEKPCARHRHRHHHEERRGTDQDLCDVIDSAKPDPSIEETLNRSVDPIIPSDAFFRPSDPAADPAPAATATSGERSAAAQQNGRAAVESMKFAIGNSAFMPREVLAVGLDPASIERAEALGFKADAQAVEASGLIITRFTVPPGLDAVRGQELLSRQLPGRRFQLNMVYRLFRPSANEKEPKLPDKDKPPALPGSAPQCGGDQCFAWQLIGWKEKLASCARGLKVGMIDTDIDEAHPAFAGRTIHRIDFSPDEKKGVPPNWHGTAVLSVMAGNPGGGTPGLIPDADFFTANVFFSDERGGMAANTLSVLKALDWMERFGIKIVNMSFSGPRDELIAEAIKKLSKKGIVFVAAAGNEGPAAEPSYPAAYPQVIAVTAVTKGLRNYRYANRGDHIDVAAPGVNIWTAMPGGRASYQSGTSFAAPHVTAILAVEPRETLQKAKADLLDGLPVIRLGQEVRDPVYGRGLLTAPSECMAPWETAASNE